MWGLTLANLIPIDSGSRDSAVGRQFVIVSAVDGAGVAVEHGAEPNYLTEFASTWLSSSLLYRQLASCPIDTLTGLADPAHKVGITVTLELNPETHIDFRPVTPCSYNESCRDHMFV